MALTDSLKSVYLTAEESTGEHTIYCALRSSLEAVRIMSTYNNAPAWTLGQGVMCHGRHIKAKYIVWFAGAFRIIKR